MPAGALPPGALATGSAVSLPSALPTLPSSSLLGGHKSVQIEHNGALYQLRTTKLGKLILTK
ncbi:hypothetical protein AAW51_2210 [Caldimonas brevitalea]|uniref:Hemin uptake protein HemP n=2 Tax=Caldimonas brevitalea TaxID=413882 RepID=A0A0G3BNH2_9BURK|nr:hypothetical protein AAW51_2210 [Caldimonas brevitalea]